MNRGQQVSADMKHDLTAYEFVPDMISNLTPGPEFPYKAMEKTENARKLKRDAKANLERIRTSYITKKTNEERFYKGRLHSHLKLQDIRTEIERIRDLEQTTTTKSLRATQKGIELPEFEIDDQFQLPYGAGFDHIIKKKAELIDSLKVANNVVMDDLIERLGYMDYRDALACNRYILEAKRSGDYHQLARASVL